jgi:hypothetical protein
MNDLHLTIPEFIARAERVESPGGFAEYVLLADGRDVKVDVKLEDVAAHHAEFRGRVCMFLHFELTGPADGSLIANGPGHVAIRRSGTGRGDAIRLHGSGLTVRSGDGDGDAIFAGPGNSETARRTGNGNGDAKHRGPGDYGTAEREGNGNGNAIRTYRYIDPKPGLFPGKKAPKPRKGHNKAERHGNGVGRALIDGNLNGDAVRTGNGRGDAHRTGGGKGNATRTGPGLGTAFVHPPESGRCFGPEDDDGDGYR